MTEGTLRILVVEDLQDTRETLRDLLEQAGHRVTPIRSLNEASGLSPGDWQGFDAALLDRRLGDGCIDPMLPRLRRLAPDCALILLTAWCERDDMLTALREGIFDYLIKPLDPELLFASLARLLNLRKAERRAREAEQLASLGQMLAVLAHEGRDALHRIKTSLTLAHRLSCHDADLSALMKLGLRGCLDLQRLFEDLRAQSGPIVLEIRPSNVYQVARDAWNDLAPRREGRQARLTIEGDADGRACLADPFRLKQVFRNLFDNALSACDDPAEIRVQCRAVAAEGQPALRLRIRDNGPGFPPEARRQAFKPFYTTKADGSGLGLSITRRIIEAHGGWISLASSTSGAELLIHLPLLGPVPAAPARTPTTPTTSHPR